MRRLLLVAGIVALVALLVPVAAPAQTSRPRSFVATVVSQRLDGLVVVDERGNLWFVSYARSGSCMVISSNRIRLTTKWLRGQGASRRLAPPSCRSILPRGFARHATIMRAHVSSVGETRLRLVQGRVSAEIFFRAAQRDAIAAARSGSHSFELIFPDAATTLAAID